MAAQSKLTDFDKFRDITPQCRIRTPSPLMSRPAKKLRTSENPHALSAEDCNTVGDGENIDGSLMNLAREPVTDKNMPAELDNSSGAAGGDEQPVVEEWEAESEILNLMPGVVSEIRTWTDLREQIKVDLKKKSLPLSKVNQLLILRNFATLRLKGDGKIDASREIARQWHEGEGVHFARKVRTLARHYQLYEQLPIERRGSAGGRSLLLDETVKSTARGWLMTQKAGTVTPRRFQRALNDDILPSLNITLAKDLCERTARRWLIKLGFRRTVLRKGVYKDGHDRDDVKKYRDTEFLPRMAKFEARMTQYRLEGGGLVPVKPILKPGEREVIALFQDECCFHANDYKTSAWYVSI